MIFNDKNNFEGCLSVLNKRRADGQKRFWKFQEYHNFFFNKLKEMLNIKNNHLELIRTYVYTGKYNSDIISALSYYCRKEINEINELIKREEALLEKISSSGLGYDLRLQIENHVNYTKNIFQSIKEQKIQVIQKQIKNSEGQKKMFEYINSLSFIELKTTNLKHARGIIYQKGIDVQIATDIVHFAHTNSYDLCLILGGDTDLIESLRLVRKGLGKIVVIVAYYDERYPLKSCISPSLIKEADYFLNMADMNEDEILSISDILKFKNKTS